MQILMENNGYSYLKTDITIIKTKNTLSKLSERKNKVVNIAKDH